MNVLITVIGTTGVGKSSLAVKLAKALGGHVINGDSMQVYQGLDIITNKPDSTELSTVPHHLFDFLDPMQEYSVSEYSRDALQKIQSLHSQNIIPVVCGGTNYYIQSLLWKQSIIETSDSPGLSNKPNVLQSCHNSIDSDLADTLCYLLEHTDPRLYSPNEIIEFSKTAPFHETLLKVDPGKPHSDWYLKQKEDLDQTTRLRYRSCVFWLYGKPEELYPRLDARVDMMINKGMFEEMDVMRKKMMDKQVVGLESQYTRGILQAIGFKEFHDYYQAVEKNLPNVENLKDKGIEEMKIATRQYARRQIAWIKNKLAPQCLLEHSQGTGAIYLIDATDAGAMTPGMCETVFSLAKDFIDQKPNHPSNLLSPNLHGLLKMKDNDFEDDIWKQYTCEICTNRSTGEHKVLNGKQEWLVHLASGVHRKTIRRLQNLGKKEAYLLAKSKNETMQQELEHEHANIISSKDT